MNYKIKITGGGTAKEIAAALKQVAANIESATKGKHEEQLLNGAEWEDKTLMTEIDEDETTGFVDKDGEPLEVGDTVTVPDPNGKDDAWSHSFTGTIDKFRNGYAVVVDGENDAFDVEPNRLELEG